MGVSGKNPSVLWTWWRYLGLHKDVLCQTCGRKCPKNEMVEDGSNDSIIEEMVHRIAARDARSTLSATVTRNGHHSDLYSL